ncbi:MAG: YigZ family protein [Aggregatilineaceae bacterium]
MSYRIPARTTRIETVIINSRFIATAARADSVDAARHFIQTVRDEMPDATHHVYAFKIGFGGSVTEGMSDDGEPSGTAGPPVLAVLRGSDIGDVVVVVTRYFGGTKLGTGGLVRAYSGAARQVLAALPTELKIEKRLIGITIPYHHFDRVQLLLHAHGATVDDKDFAAEVTVYATVPADELPALTREIENLTGGQTTVVLLDANA